MAEVAVAAESEASESEKSWTWTPGAGATNLQMPKELLQFPQLSGTRQELLSSELQNQKPIEKTQRC